MSEIDAAELARLQKLNEGLPGRPDDQRSRLTVGETRALLDALDKARGREISDRAKAEIREALTNAEAERDSSRALLRDITTWAQHRCPCDNDEPKICPLCDADVATDLCMAVDVSFPRTIRARIAQELGQ